MKKRKKSEILEKSFNMLYILPMIIVYLVFIIYPMGDVMRLSFYDKKVNGDMIYIGLKNFADFFADPDTPMIFMNTAIWVFVGTALIARLRAGGVEVVDPLPAFRAAGGRSLYRARDVHLNADGNALAAQAVLAHLQRGTTSGQ